MKAWLFSAALVLAAIPAAAQTAAAPWEPFLGCWELAGNNLRDRTSTSTRPPAARPADESGPRVCVTRTTDGARFETTLSGQPAIDQTLVADGAAHPLNDAECKGTQQAEFSRDGLRLFSNATLTCQGDPGQRRVSGISFIAANGTWLDIQAIDVGGRESVRVRRYYRARGERAIPAATVAASKLTLDDVKEASPKLVPRALEAALVESNAGFDLSGKDLLALDDAGVADSVVDLMVALSYPERFVIERNSSGGGGGFGGSMFDNDPFALGWAFGYPVWYDNYFYSPYYYRPFGYAGYGYNGYYSAFGDGAVIVPGPSEPQPSGNGRVVDGQGYTRIRPRETAAAADGRSDSGSRTSSRSGVVDTPSTPSSGGSSGTASTGGYSSGGGGASSSGGGDSGRTAVPR